jgi:hypothetical protein
MEGTMSETEPRGVPAGGDALSGDDVPTGNDGTAGSDALSGDATAEETDTGAAGTAGADRKDADTTIGAGPVDDDAVRDAFEANDELGGRDAGTGSGDEA